MSLVRALVRDGVQLREALPGDLMSAGENVDAGALAADAGMVLTAAAIASGIIVRSGTGGGAGFTDTTDTADNIITALKGNASAVDVVPGSTFRLLYINTIAQAMTLAGGVGVLLKTTGSGVNNVAASLWREYLMKVKNSTPAVTLSCLFANASKSVTLVTPVAPGIITPGMSLSGTNLTTGTLIVGLTMNGSGQISGFTTDTNSTGDSSAVASAVLCSPAIEVTGLRSGTA